MENPPQQLGAIRSLNERISRGDSLLALSREFNICYLAYLSQILLEGWGKYAKVEGCMTLCRIKQSAQEEATL